ncbi:hypothetical protein OH76DRAFT_1104073 [Lentinus brumalis]|uniref:Uncharacterized protein n=1 Tax=Lentinus brumalis TaxID=2498619 RepID=A0A371CVD5_9APHY|nr:hypothetical protein OH76DRAFT_1104073 [Polyporus brumalis]
MSLASPGAIPCRPQEPCCRATEHERTGYEHCACTHEHRSDCLHAPGFVGFGVYAGRPRSDASRGSTFASMIRPRLQSAVGRVFAGSRGKSTLPGARSRMFAPAAQTTRTGLVRAVQRRCSDVVTVGGRDEAGERSRVAKGRTGNGIACSARFLDALGLPLCALVHGCTMGVETVVHTSYVLTFARTGARGCCAP